MPSRAGVMPNTDDVSATRTSHAIAICVPPPTHEPLMNATVGFGNDPSASSAPAFAAA